MNQYVTFRDKDRDGNLQYYILQRDFPHYVGIVSSTPIAEVLFSAPIPGYRLYVVFSGTLRGNYVPSYTNVMAEIEAVFNAMAAWYFSERILTQEKKYSKFKIRNNA
jgi:hypothetical protein